jgi:hypothetical protein
MCQVKTLPLRHSIVSAFSRNVQSVLIPAELLFTVAATVNRSAMSATNNSILHNVQTAMYTSKSKPYDQMLAVYQQLKCVACSARMIKVVNLTGRATNEMQ